MIKRVRMVLFDFNGTMVDDIHLNRGSIDHIFDSYHIPRPDPKEWRSRVSSNILSLYHSFGIPKSATIEDLNKLRYEYMSLSILRARIRPGLDNLLKKLRASCGIRSAIFSAEIGDVIGIKLAQAGLTKRFSLVYADARPKSEHLPRFLKMMQIGSETCAYIDDTAEGVKLSREFGMVSIALVCDTSYSPPEMILAERPDVVIHSMGEAERLFSWESIEIPDRSAG